MKLDARDLRFGPYRTPRYKLRTWVNCEYRARVKITGTSDARISWPMTTLPNGVRVLIVYRVLAKAVRHESYPILRHWFGATAHSVRRWRKALHVKDTPGNDALRKLHATPERHAMMGQAAAAVARNPERRAKIAAAKRGKPRPPEVFEALRRANIGKKNSPAARAKMSASHQKRERRGRMDLQPSTDAENDVVRTLPPTAADARRGIRSEEPIEGTPMKRFTVPTEGPDRFGLGALCQRYVDEQWLADHATPEQAAAMVREQFKRAVLADIELLDVKCREAKTTS